MTRTYNSHTRRVSLSVLLVLVTTAMYIYIVVPEMRGLRESLKHISRVCGPQACIVVDQSTELPCTATESFRVSLLTLATGMSPSLYHLFVAGLTRYWIMPRCPGVSTLCLPYSTLFRFLMSPTPWRPREVYLPGYPENPETFRFNMPTRVRTQRLYLLVLLSFFLFSTLRHSFCSRNASF